MSVSTQTITTTSILGVIGVIAIIGVNSSFHLSIISTTQIHRLHGFIIIVGDRRRRQRVVCMGRCQSCIDIIILAIILITFLVFGYEILVLPWRRFTIRWVQIYLSMISCVKFLISDLQEFWPPIMVYYGFPLSFHKPNINKRHTPHTPHSVFDNDILLIH